MRLPKYLSPSALMTWEKDPEEYYIKYLAANRPPKIPQDRPMSIGSAFDAKVKAYLCKCLFDDDRLPYEKIFEEQVEEQNRDWARKEVEPLFQWYLSLGALADLLTELQDAVGEPRFEFSVEGKITHFSVEFGVPILGKPDIYFVNRSGGHILYDIKVNGFCSKSKVSPAKGYVKVRGKGRNENQPHPDAFLQEVDGIVINVAHPMDIVNTQWATQLTTYSWLVGEPIENDCIIGVEQILNDGSRIAHHRCKVNKSFQRSCFERYASLWKIIHSRHIFQDMSEEESLKRCQLLDDTYKDYKEGDSDLQWFSDVTRKG